MKPLKVPCWQMSGKIRQAAKTKTSNEHENTITDTEPNRSRNKDIISTSLKNGSRERRARALDKSRVSIILCVRPRVRIFRNLMKEV